MDLYAVILLIRFFYANKKVTASANYINYIVVVLG